VSPTVPAGRFLPLSNEEHARPCPESHLPPRASPTRPYGLVIFAAKRARQINAYYSQLSEGLLEYVGPLVDTAPQEKPLSIALREINEGLLTHTAGEN
jgi:DNA-directed RNA polymerase subunit omega